MFSLKITTTVIYEFNYALQQESYYILFKSKSFLFHITTYSTCTPEIVCAYVRLCCQNKSYTETTGAVNPSATLID